LPNAVPLRADSGYRCVHSLRQVRDLPREYAHGMNRMVGAAVERLWLALAVSLGTGVFLMLWLLIATTSAASVVVLAAVAASVAAGVGPNRLSVTPVSDPLALPRVQ